jgi:DNA-binding MarR family transcriptional regulator
LESDDMDRLEIIELNPLQLFLLVLVEFGLATPYDLLSKAGLGAGLTSPALKRLKEARMLNSKPGPRNRVRYDITEKGRKTLRETLEVGPPPFWQQGQTDVFESLPRGVILAWLNSGTHEAKQGIAEAAYKLSVLERKRQREAEELRASMVHLQSEIVNQSPVAAKGVLIATAYQWIKAECDARLFRLKREAVSEIIKLLPDLPPAPQLPRDRGQS